MRPINCGFRSLKGKASIVNAVNKLYSVWIYENHICVLPSKELYEWRSSQLNTQFLQLRKESLKKTQACTGFEPLTSAITVQRSTNSANKPTGSRSLVPYKPVKGWWWSYEYMKIRICELRSKELYELRSSQLHTQLLQLRKRKPEKALSKLSLTKFNRPFLYR